MRPDFRVRPDLADASSPDGRLWRLYGLGTGEARRPSWGAISWIKGLMVCLACGAPPRWRNTYMSYKGARRFARGKQREVVCCVPNLHIVEAHAFQRSAQLGRGELL